MAENRLTPRQLLTKWVSQQMFTTQPDSAPIRCFKLHLPKEGTHKTNVVGEVIVGADSQAEPIANDLFEYAQQDANTNDAKSVRYVVRAYYGASTGIEPRGGRYTLKLSPERVDNDDDDTFIGATDERGAMAQMSRLLERSMTMFAVHADTIMSQQTTMIRHLTEEVRQSYEQRLKTHTYVEELLNMRTEREILLRRQAKKERREDMAISMFLNFVLPQLLAKKADLDTATAVWLGSLSQKQMESIMGSLDGKQAGPFMMILERAIAIKGQLEEAKKASDVDEKVAKEVADKVEGKGIGVENKAT